MMCVIFLIFFQINIGIIEIYILYKVIQTTLVYLVFIFFSMVHRSVRLIIELSDYPTIVSSIHTRLKVDQHSVLNGLNPQKTSKVII